MHINLSGRNTKNSFYKVIDKTIVLNEQTARTWERVTAVPRWTSGPAGVGLVGPCVTGG